jgi:hypothetical protein
LHQCRLHMKAAFRRICIFIGVTNFTCFKVIYNLMPPGLCSCLMQLSSTKQIPWPESASELYRPSDRRLLAKLVPTFAERGMSRSQRGRSPLPLSRISRSEPLLFFQVAPCTQEAEWTPFQTRYFSENLVALGIETGPLDLWPGL